MATAPLITRSDASTWRLNRAITNRNPGITPSPVITGRHRDRAITSRVAHPAMAGATTASVTTVAIAVTTAATAVGNMAAVVIMEEEVTGVAVEKGAAGTADAHASAMIVSTLVRGNAARDAPRLLSNEARSVVGCMPTRSDGHARC
ncbi:hypothetical protein AO275_16710 [Pseudomonas viridiflava]|nr:hypothetical protein AO275_16710 [Pseudomonas viridiflava]